MGLPNCGHQYSARHGKLDVAPIQGFIQSHGVDTKPQRSIGVAAEEFCTCHFGQARDAPRLSDTALLFYEFALLLRRFFATRPPSRSAEGRMRQGRAQSNGPRPRSFR
jgi:hypothetical protein